MDEDTFTPEVYDGAWDRPDLAAHYQILLEAYNALQQLFQPASNTLPFRIERFIHNQVNRNSTLKYELRRTRAHIDELPTKFRADPDYHPNCPLNWFQDEYRRLQRDDMALKARRPDAKTLQTALDKGRKSAKENNRLAEENNKLAEEKNRLPGENDRLVGKNNRLLGKNSTPTEENDGPGKILQQLDTQLDT